MPRGGNRPGSGRPTGKGRWGEPTKALRIPVSLSGAVEDFIEARGFKIPLYSSNVPAGSPFPASDHVESYIDLNQSLIKNPAETFLLRVDGDSMVNAGIHDRDLIIVDRSIQPTNGKIVVAYIDNQATVKRLKRGREGVFLMPENKRYKPIKVTKFSDLKIAGVVTGIARKIT